MSTDNETECADDDLIQATSLCRIEAVERSRAESRLRTLLVAVAWKKLRRDLCGRPRVAEPIESLAANDPTYGSEFDANRDFEVLRKAMRRLPDDTQTVLALFYWEVMSIQEIARTVEQPASTVKTRLRRGRAQLLEDLTMLRGEGHRDE